MPKKINNKTKFYKNYFFLLFIFIILGLLSIHLYKNITKPKLDIYLWGISNNKKYIYDNCKYSLNTAYKYGLKPKILGLNHDNSHIKHLKWGSVLSRFYLLRDLTNTIHDNRILLIMDGFDTLFRGTKEQIIKRFLSQKTDLLISAENTFTYQWEHFKDKYDKTNKIYKYVNAGTFIGYSDSIKKMANTCINYINNSNDNDTGNDQGLLGKYVYNNLQNHNQIKLDSDNSIFWVTTGDSKLLENNYKFNPITKTYPIIYHVICGRRDDFKVYLDVYNKIMEE